MLFKTDEEKEEFHEIDTGVQHMLLFMDAYSQHHFGVELYVTELVRSDEEQDDIYGDDEVYQNHPWKSYHQLKLAADLRYNLDFNQWSELLTMTERLFMHLEFNCVVHTPDNEEGWIPHVHVELQLPYERSYGHG